MRRRVRAQVLRIMLVSAALAARAGEDTWGPFRLDTRTGYGSIPVLLATGYTLVGLPFTDCGVTVASDLLALDPEARASGIWEWDAVTQSWRGYVPAAGGQDFPLTVGRAYFLACEQGRNTSLAGAWATGAPLVLRTGWNLLCVPKDRSEWSVASTLLSACGPSARGAWRWDGARQRWQSYLTGFGGHNFYLTVGDPVLVFVDREVNLGAP